MALMATHVCISSGGFIFVKLALGEFSAFALGFWRLLFGLIGLLVYTLIFKSWQAIERKDWTKIAMLAFLAVPVNQVGYIYGMKFTVPSHAALLYGCTAVFAILFSVWIGYEKFRRSRLGAIVLAISGLLIVISGARTQMLGSENISGDLIVLAAVIAWAGYTVLARPLVMKYGATRATMICLVIGSAMGLPFLGVSAYNQNYNQVTWIGWTGALYAGLILTGVNYAVWFSMLKYVDPSQVAIATTPQPVVTTLLSTFILGEVITLNLVVGGLMVISAVLMMNYPQWVRKLLPI